MDTDSRQTGIATISALSAVTQNGMSVEWCASLFKKWTLFVIRYGLTSQKTCIFNSPLHGQEFSHTARIKLLVFFKPLFFFMSISALYVLLLLEGRNDKGIPCETLSAAPVSSVFQFAVSGVICFHKEIDAALTHMWWVVYIVFASTL